MNKRDVQRATLEQADSFNTIVAKFELPSDDPSVMALRDKFRRQYVASPRKLHSTTLLLTQAWLEVDESFTVAKACNYGLMGEGVASGSVSYALQRAGEEMMNIARVEGVEVPESCRLSNAKNFRAHSELARHLLNTYTEQYLPLFDQPENS